MMDLILDARPKTSRKYFLHQNFQNSRNVVKCLYEKIVNLVFENSDFLHKEDDMSFEIFDQMQIRYDLNLKLQK